ncbi:MULTISPECIES: hypothetical protein [Paenibacillus]|uniref:hypothetical protein n=1 Tax=Paenibacillus TaxID=44249 RepID=UPI0022B866C7|nr:hypothetical protein [Paenibacillus caseinilyticus]MCZ8523387.1 hypothetical protein [Paenibacillus caseinilyticus]
MPAESCYYIIYDDFSISICTMLDEVCDAVAGGALLYGYTDNEDMAQLLLNECFHVVQKEKT